MTKCFLNKLKSQFANHHLQFLTSIFYKSNVTDSNWRFLSEFTSPTFWYYPTTPQLFITTPYWLRNRSKSAWQHHNSRRTSKFWNFYTKRQAASKLWGNLALSHLITSSSPDFSDAMIDLQDDLLSDWPPDLKSQQQLMHYFLVIFCQYSRHKVAYHKLKIENQTQHSEKTGIVLIYS